MAKIQQCWNKECSTHYLYSAYAPYCCSKCFDRCKQKASVKSFSFLKTITTMLAIVLLSGCISMEKAAEKATKTEERAKYTNAQIKAKYPHVSAFDCATWYPIRETVVTKRDTVKTLVTVPGDSIPCPPVTDTKTGKVYVTKVKCPDVSYFQEQITELTEKTQESTSKLETANLTINKVKGELLEEKKAHLQTMEERDKAKKQRNTAYAILGVIALLVAGVVVLKILKPF